MKILLKYLIKNIKENYLRSLLIIFSIALAAGVFYVSINIYDDVIDNSIAIFQGTTKGYDLLIKNENNKLINYPEYEDILNIQREKGIYEVSEDIQLNISCNFVDVEKLIDSKLITLNTAKANDFNKNDAIISRAKAKYFDIDIGDEYIVLIDNKENKVVIKDIVDSLGIFNETNLNSLEMFIDNKNLDTNYQLLKLKSDTKLEDSYNKLKENDIDVEYLNYQNNRSEADNVKKVMLVILLLVMILVLYVISSTTKLLLNYRLQILGTFRSLGASKFQVGMLLIIENMFYATSGGLIGLLLGDGIRRIIRNQIFSLESVPIKISQLLFVLLFAIIFDLMITIFSIIKTANTKIINLIFIKQNSYYRYPMILGISGLILLFVSFYLASINKELDYKILIYEIISALVGVSLLCGLVCRIFSKLFSSLLKSISGEAWMGFKNQGANSINIRNAVLLTIVIALILTVYIGVDSLSRFIDKYADSYNYDIIIKGANNDYSFYHYLYDVDGVERIKYEFWDNTRLSIDGKEIAVSLVSNNGNANGIETYSVKINELKNGEIIVDQKLALENDLKIGDTINFTGYYHYIAKVVGYCDSSIYNSSRKAVVLTQHDYEKYITCSPAIIGVGINENVGLVVSRIMDANYQQGEIELDIFTKDQYVDKSVLLASKAIGVIKAVPILVLLLAFLGIQNNQIISFIQKKHIYAVLCSTSMSKKQVKKMLFNEIFATTIVGVLMGLGLGSWLIKIVNDVIYVTLAYIKIVINPMYVMLMLIALIMLMLMSIVIPYRQLKEMEIIKETNYE